MNYDPNAAAHIVRLNGGSLVGNTRFQKTTYFLEALDVGFGFDFDYHYYGPYCDDLKISIEDSVFLGLISSELGTTNSGNEYSRYDLIDDPITDDASDQKREIILEILRNYDSVSLEIAATADFLKNNGSEQDFWEETKKRKASKCTEFYLERAEKILEALEQIS